MTIARGDLVMTSTKSGHAALRLEDGWHISYLPGRVFTDLQAMTAIVLAELLAHGPVRPRYKRHVQNWMRELGVDESELPQPIQGVAALGGELR